MAAVKIFQYEVKDAQNESDRKISQIAESQQRTENKIEGMIQAQKESDRKISELAESQKEFTQVLKELIQAQKELTDAQKQTDKKLGELADAQKRTENRMEELAEAQKELSDAQKRTETKVGELADAQKRTENRMEELAEAQKRTETKVGELADAQKRTENRMEELAEAQNRTELEVSKLSSGLNGVRKQIGGLSKSVAYSLENEAYRKLPGYLKNRFHISMEERLIRTTVGEKEINIFAKARQNGNEVIIVGECVLKLDDRSKLGQLEESVEIVKQHYHQPVVPLVITHFAQSDIFRKASEEGIIVVQSFEWE